ncbi:TRAP transporter permease [Marinomonas primoryensis]|jgi:TRAP transporter 4TM/12TM fusion protein|uniref:Tripartite ATP-independent periplasmic transporter protein DctM n=1 Tax=Marinomonas primoryensis TaxID=178399 RepID=A0A859CWQ9_9GAMM|nr:TRAP transporter fused permease subunit [Marinomonas primoryensis]QKK80984.1 Tripartite ATP-independent periplasmic transporter protein DctM [Marinomonas primoryensis]|tara:strand:+ start:5484 stop:7427 length:1944 start_codon:yes stop_codon:yes gene_type:complete
MNVESSTQEVLTTEPAIMPALRNSLGVLITLAAIAFAADLFSRLGIAIYTEQYLAAILGISLALVFIKPQSSQLKRSLNGLLALLGLITSLYLAVQYPDLVERQLDLTLDSLTVSAILFALVLEGLRRVVGITLVIVVLLFMTFALIGNHLSGPLQTREISLDRLFVYLGVDTNGMLGLTLNVAATIVIGFILFGQLLLRSGGADFFNDVALSLMGKRKGGSGKIATIASALFGSISGVVVSNIVATGVVTIRMMKKGGFKPHTAAAIETVASTGGQIMPPVMGAVAFLMAEFLQISYSDVVLAALVPAILYYAALYIQVDLEAAKEQIMPIDPALIPSKRKVLKQGWIFIVPFAAVILALFSFNQRPETAALWGALGALIVGVLKGYKGKRMGAKDILGSLEETGHSIVDIIMIGAAAGFIIGILNITGLGFGLTYFLVELGQGNLFLLLVISAVVCIVLGMGMPTVGVYLLLAVLVAPSLIQVGVEPIAAHLFIFYLGMMSMVTPPIAIGAFFAASIAKANPMKTALTSMRLGWTAYIIPFLFVTTPSLLLIGETSQIVITVISALVGVWAISVGFAGYFKDKLNFILRVGFVISGGLFLFPNLQGGDTSIIPKVVGLGLLVALLLVASFMKKTTSQLSPNSTQP